MKARVGERKRVREGKGGSWPFKGVCVWGRRRRRRRRTRTAKRKRRRRRDTGYMKREVAVEREKKERKRGKEGRE